MSGHQRMVQVGGSILLAAFVVMLSLPFLNAGELSAPKAESLPSAKTPDQAKPIDEAGNASSVKDDSKVVSLDGQAVFYGPALRKMLKLELVDDSLDKVVAFQTEDGRLIPILPTDSGLFFLRDERVRNRPMRITARVRDKVAGLEVITFHSLVDGKPNEIYYWCEICSIQMYHLKECDCCQGPIELREHPVGETFRLKGK